jgi:RNA polymerase sigma-70 factor (ECF subfamily)
MLSFCDGDDRAFDEIVRRYKSKLVNYINKYIYDFDRAEEIAQEVFLRVYRSRDRYQVKAKFSTFVYRIALNLSYNEVRDRNRRKTDPTDEFSTFDMKDTNTPDVIYEKDEVEQIIHREISKLKDKYRDVIILCDIEKNSYKQTAAILDISVGTVQSRLSRGRIKLRQNLEKYLK